MAWWEIALIVVLSSIAVLIATALIFWRIASNRTKRLATRIGALSWSEKFDLAKRLMADERIPLVARLLLPALVIYLALPIDLIPDFVPIIGQVDDIVVILVGIALLVRLTPTSVLDQHLSDLEPAIDVTPTGRLSSPSND
jgi:uncharacterized membrane protein YkvA (DUF1232 family)